MDYYWIWIAVGFGLIFLEILTPGFYFLWVGLSAVVTGAINFFAPDLSFIILGTVFAALSIIFCYLGKVSLYKNVKAEGAEKLNRRGEQYVGTIVKVVEAFEAGRGKVRVGDTVWSAKSKKDHNVGDSVKISAVDGTFFIVE